MGDRAEECQEGGKMGCIKEELRYIPRVDRFPFPKVRAYSAQVANSRSDCRREIYRTAGYDVPLSAELDTGG